MFSINIFPDLWYFMYKKTKLVAFICLFQIYTSLFLILKNDIEHHNIPKIIL